MELKLIFRYGQKTLWSILRDHRCRQQSAVLAEGKTPTQPQPQNQPNQAANVKLNTYFQFFIH